MNLYVNVIGGLGNQMFQYAFGLGAANRTGGTLRPVVDMYYSYRLHHGYVLDRVCKVSAATASRDELRSVLGPVTRKPAVRKALARPGLGWLRPAKFVAEGSFRYGDVTLSGRGPAVYCHGYWQSPRYFEHCEGEVRREFQLREPPDSENARLMAEMRSETSVSLHVRRGDFLSVKANQGVYARLPVDYYRNSVSRVRASFPDARFYAFSDDPDWVHEVLGPAIPGLKVIAHNKGAMSHMDMYLMAACKHHITANSTFSWWGAWLNPSPQKLVVTPKRWFDSKLEDTDLVPPEWVRV